MAFAFSKVRLQVLESTALTLQSESYYAQIINCIKLHTTGPRQLTENRENQPAPGAIMAIPFAVGISWAVSKMLSIQTHIIISTREHRRNAGGWESLTPICFTWSPMFTAVHLLFNLFMFHPMWTSLQPDSTCEGVNESQHASFLSSPQEKWDTFYTKHLLYQTPFKPGTFYTRHLLNPTPFTPDNFFTKHILQQAPFTPNTLYTRHLLYQAHLHQTPFTPDTFYTRHLLTFYTRHLLQQAIFNTRHLLHQAPCTPNNTVYTRHLFTRRISHHAPFTPDNFHSRQLLHQPTFTPHQIPFTPKTFYTRHLLNQAPFTPDTFYTRHLLHQTTFSLNTFYNRHLLHQTPCTPDTFYTRHIFTRHLLHPTFFTPDTF